MNGFIVKTWQIVTYFIIGIPLRMVCLPNRRYEATIKRSRYIIACNHPTRIDPFIVCYTFPLRDFLKLIPFRFITADEYMRAPYGPILRLFGCISTRGLVLRKAKELLEKGETIFIFPRGFLERKGKPAPKIGAIWLEREVKGSMILPVRIKYRNGSYSIYYKKPIRHAKYPKDLSKNAAHLMELIENS